MKEVEQVTADYLPIAQACSSVFFILEQLNLVHHFYQFSLRFFLDIFDYALHHNPHLRGVSDHGARRDILLKDLFLITYRRTSCALFHKDHVMLAVLLAQVKLRGLEDINDELEFLLETGDGSAAASISATRVIDCLTTEQQQRLNTYSKHSLFKPVESHIIERQDEWVPFLSSSNPESAVPTPWDPSTCRSFLTIYPQTIPDYFCTAAVEAIRSLLIIKCLRPDRLLQATAIFVQTVFGVDLSVEASFDLGAMVADEVKAQTPLALVSVSGHDASYRVEGLIQSTQSRCTQVAMGSQEGFGLADQAIGVASRQGTWVLLKNVHLAPSWLG
jgi:dynein heavy chain 1